MIEEKERLLAGEKPRCRLSRERVDLSDAAAREAFLSKATAGAKQALVISEGLLAYFDDEQVRALGRHLARPPIRWWLLDVAAPAILKMMVKGMGDRLRNAPMKFAPPDGVAFFEALGWKARDIRSIFRSAVEFRRVPAFLRLFSLFPEPDPRKPGNARWSAVVRLERP
jgi:O-methyltransferase involved in polyketide biosynthesis